MVNRLVREDGLRYREIAVITGDPVSYGRELIHPFEEAGIPYFMDQKKSILENPMVELIRAALETVRDCSYESVFRKRGIQRKMKILLYFPGKMCLFLPIDWKIM